MVLVYLINGDCIEIPAAHSTQAREGSLYCLDADDSEIVFYPIEDVEAFTTNERLAELMKAEVCERLIVIGDQETTPLNS
jgi:hypothetical protein